MNEIIQTELYADPEVATERATEQNASDPESRTLPKPTAAQSRSSILANRSAIGPSPTVALEEERVPLFTPNQANDLRAHWDCVQAGFVDEPRQAVRDADALVSTAVIQLSEIFVDERQKLEREWDRGDISTEDLRVALRRYRSFFAQILSA
jgi:hypothetical protein